MYPPHLQAAAVRAQLEAQLEAQAAELAGAQRQLAALQQQLLSQRSAGAGASSAAAAEVDQLRRQLATERQRREEAERAATQARQVRGMVTVQFCRCTGGGCRGSAEMCAGMRVAVAAHRLASAGALLVALSWGWMRCGSLPCCCLHAAEAEPLHLRSRRP